MTKKTKQPILTRALRLFLIFAVGLAIVILSFTFKAYTDNVYRERTEQQDVKQYLGQMILTQLIALENEFNKIDTIDDARDLALAEKRIEKLINETQDILLVFQNGGEIKQIIPANIGGVDETERITTYYPPENEGYQIAVLELSPRLLDLEVIAQKIIASVDKGLGESDPDLRLASANETAFLLKQADSFFLRSRESANRIYYECNLEMQATSAEKDKVIKKVTIISTLTILSVIIFGCILSYSIFQQISELLKERKRAEKSLREAEKRYRTVADFTYDWEYWRAPDGKLLYISPSCERITGYSVSDFSKNAEFLQEIVIPEDKEIWKKHGQEIAEEHSPQEIQFRIKRKDGEIIWIEHTCQPVTIATGEFVGYRASNCDVTQRVEASLSLKESEERYRLLAENMSDFIWITDLENLTITYASPSVKQLLGFLPQEVEALSIEERLPPDTIKMVLEALHQEIIRNEIGANPDRTRTIDIELYNKEGLTVLCETTMRFLYDDEGNPRAIMGTSRNIEAKVQAENALRENEELYRSLVESSPIGILLASPKGEIISVNEATLKIIGSPSKEATKKINLLTFPPIAKSSFASDFKKCLATEERVENQMYYTSKWGKKVYVRYTLTSIRGAKDELLGIQVLLDNVTNRMKRKNDIERQVKNLATINAINTALITRTDRDQMIKKVIEEIVKNLSVDAADLLIFDEPTLSLTCTAQYGFRSPAGKKKTVLRVGEGYAGEAALKREIVEIYNLAEKRGKALPQRWQDENFSTYIGVPLLVKGRLKGILEVFHRSNEKRSQAWMDFFKTLAQQAAIAIDNHSLLSALRHSNIELELAYETTLEGWARALELRDYETKGHTERVANLTLELAQNLGVHGDKLAHIRRGALLHDIGKIAISDTILLKKGTPTPEEWQSIYQHPQYGYDMLKEIDYLKPSLDIVLYHHEKWDGSGYPRGLARERIPFSARIFAIVDVWDAIINERHYHEAWTRKEALIHIKRGAGIHFDPQVAKAFLQIVG